MKTVTFSIVLMAVVYFWRTSDLEIQNADLTAERDSLQLLCNSWEKAYRDLDTKCTDVVQIIPDSAIRFMATLMAINERREKECAKTLTDLEECINQTMKTGKSLKAWRISQDQSRYWRDRYYDCVKRLPQKQFLELQELNLKQRRVKQDGLYYNVWNGNYYEIN